MASEDPCPRTSRARMRKALGLGGVSPSPPHPGHALTPAADPELVLSAGPAQPGESVVREPEMENQCCYVWDLERIAAPEPDLLKKKKKKSLGPWPVCFNG